MLQLFCSGLTAKEVAIELGISRRTVEAHAQHIITKTAARNLLHAVMILLDRAT